MSDQLLFNGLLNINKPSGITSRDAVNRVQHWFPKRTRIGHTGTLDPLADGVLVLCIGQATRVVEYVQNMDKVYETEITLGAVSDTDDAQGVITPQEVQQQPSFADLETHADRFRGEILQTPPQYSALKVNGRRAYKTARRGEAVAIQPRTVPIYELEILSYTFPNVKLLIHCGKGTYIRSIARDLGESLGCGAYVNKLRRQRVGPFLYADSKSLNAEKTPELLPIELALISLPRYTMNKEQAQYFCRGTQVSVHGAEKRTLSDGEYVVYDDSGQLLGLAEHRSKVLQPSKVFVVNRGPILEGIKQESGNENDDQDSQ